jgi:N-acetylglucosaminyldiphosphoundecaprenol N-acetyl-beta-D-mannosaminyltransferase
VDIDRIESSFVGGAVVTRLDLMQTAELMLELAQRPARPEGPYFMTSVNGETLARRVLDRDFARLIDSADYISADGQPLITASHLFSRLPLPERVATTDLYPLVALMAPPTGVSFYLFGGDEAANRGAFETTKGVVPGLDIRGRSHGYLQGAALEAKLDEINALAPDILWLGLGVPREQKFVRDYAHRLKNIKIIKTSGGLFDFISGAKPRAPAWMQHAGLEWAFRLGVEPRRLVLRYLTTNPVAAYLLLTQTR